MKDLEVRDIMHIVNNLIRLHRVQVAKKKMQSINSTEIFAYRTSKCKLCKKEETNIEIQ